MVPPSGAGYIALNFAVPRDSCTQEVFVRAGLKCLLVESRMRDVCLIV